MLSGLCFSTINRHPVRALGQLGSTVNEPSGNVPTIALHGASHAYRFDRERRKTKEALTFPGSYGAKGIGEATQKETLRIIRYRNRIAHTGGNAADVSATV